MSNKDNKNILNYLHNAINKSKHNKYKYIEPETVTYSSDTVCSCDFSICKCHLDNPANRLSVEGYGRMEDELSDIQQEDYDAVYGRQDTVYNQFDSNDDLPKQAGRE